MEDASAVFVAAVCAERDRLEEEARRVAAQQGNHPLPSCGVVLRCGAFMQGTARALPHQWSRRQGGARRRWKCLLKP